MNMSARIFIGARTVIATTQERDIGRAIVVCSVRATSWLGTNEHERMGRVRRVIARPMRAVECVDVQTNMIYRNLNGLRYVGFRGYRNGYCFSQSVNT